MESVEAIRPLLLPTADPAARWVHRPTWASSLEVAMGNVRMSGPYGVAALHSVSRMTIGPAAETGTPLAVTLSVCAPGTSCRNSVASWSMVPGAPYASAVIGSGVHPPYWPNGKEVCERPARTAGTTPFLGPAANVVAIRVCSNRLPITDRHPLVPVISRPYVRCHVRTSFRAAVAHSSCGVFWRRRWLTRHRARAHQSSLGAPGTAPATHAGPWAPCSSRVA